jgi:phosphatidylglycerophosphatase A
MPATPTLAALLRQPSHALAFGLGAGLAPRAPGTVGSLVALPLYLLLAPLALPFYLALLAGLLLLGVWVTARTERDLGVHDHPGIVFDEIVGQLAALTLAPLNIVWLLAGFGLFRLFDIWKPGPIRWLNNRVPGGWGIMLDDLAAGLAAAASLHGLMYLYGH